MIPGPTPHHLLRGQVWKLPVLLPDRGAGYGYVTRQKYVVLLQSETSPMAMPSDVAFVIASTRRDTSPVRPFEVLVGAAVGFDHETLIDGRSVYTLPKQQFQMAQAAYYFELDSAIMTDLSAAIFVGLQLT